MHPYIEKVFDITCKRNHTEPLFLQAVQEVLESLTPVVEEHPELEELNVLERICEPERQVIFRIVWQDDQGGRDGNVLEQPDEGRGVEDESLRLIVQVLTEGSKVAELEAHELRARLRIRADAPHADNFRVVEVLHHGGLALEADDRPRVEARRVVQHLDGHGLPLVRALVNDPERSPANDLEALHVSTGPGLARKEPPDVGRMVAALPALLNYSLDNLGSKLDYLGAHCLAAARPERPREARVRPVADRRRAL